jgi:hypothetical protein
MKAFLCAAFALVFSVAAAQAESFSFQGSSLSDDQLQLFSFTLTTPATVTFQTFGYGGGTNAAGTVIAPGGYESLLNWFGSDGSYINNSTTCGSGKTYAGACLDASGQGEFSAGTYTLALTQSGNGALCASGSLGDLDCGFSQQGQGDYTPVTTVEPDCTAFCGTFGTQENGSWAVDILNVSSASVPDATPEPMTLLLAGCGLALIGFARRGPARRIPEISKFERNFGDRS